MNQAVKQQFFTRQLTAWHTTINDRSLPWKSEKDPYRIWLSEVMLQQTRAQQGLPYYLRFTTDYPTVKDLAAASDEDVFRLWQGLGYYNRCKNMLATARYIANELNGVFPATLDDIQALKGVGTYTAAAIASFAFGLPHAVVDGNVYRVLARYFGIDTPIDTTAGKQLFAGLAHQLLDTENSAAYNQAIMDLGATVCTPRNPRCSECPVQKNCVAYGTELVNVLPVKSKKLTIQTRYFHYLLLHWQDTVWIHKRTANDIWENLHEPMLVEHSEPLDLETLQNNELFMSMPLTIKKITFAGKATQRLTHRIIESRFFSVVLDEKPDLDDWGGMWLSHSELKKTAFPKTLVSFLENNFYF
jgi:A/G-specific adenine glycosylase